MIVYQANDTQRADIELDNKSQRKWALLGQHLVNLSFTLDSYVDFSIGDYINFKGVKYIAYKQPIAKKNKADQWDYNIDFFSPQYQYDNVMMLLNGESDFYLRGQVEDFLGVVIENMNRLGTGYSLASFPAGSGYKNLQFDGESCLAALQKVCNEYDLEYKFSDDGKTLTVGSDLGSATGLNFEFKQGLRNIERKEVNDGVFFTRLYAYGGKRNVIAGTYGANRLKLTAPGYIEANVGVFGVIEKSKIFDEIYPRREGEVTSVDGANELVFTDNLMDFNVNDYLLNSTAKVTFNTGLLAGYEFEIEVYDNATKQFSLIPIIDDQDTTLPNSTRKPSVGDKYVIHDISMPPSYITAAEAELASAAQDFLDEYSQPNVVYDIVPDPVYFETNIIDLEVGDILTITDQDFGITLQTKIIELSQSVANPYVYSIKVGNKATVSYLTRVLLGVKSNYDAVQLERIDRTAQVLKIANRVKDLQAVTDLVFDVDGYFDPTKIKPLSIETQSLAVGAKPLSMQFDGLEVELNYNASQNQWRITESTMYHFTIEDTPRSWTISSDSGTIPDNDSRYLYVRVVSTPGATTGQWVLDTAQRTIDHEAGYYTFLVGIIHAVRDGGRGLSMLYGQTFINGRYITTGRVQDLTGNSYFDLDQNKFIIGDGTNSLDWNVTTPNTLTIKGALVQSQSGDTFPQFVYRGEYDNAVMYYKGDGVTYNGRLWLYINGTPTIGSVPAENAYWDLVTEKGADGTDGTDGSGVSIKGTEANEAAILALPGPHTEGDLYIAGDTGDGYVWDGTQFTNVGPVRGPEGPQGPQGNQGVQGPQGPQGETYYTWVKYADTPTTGMSDLPTGKTYIGLAYNKLTAVESTDYADYEWFLFKGDTGVQGPPGADGQQYWTWIKYADDASGNGMSDSPVGKEYIGIAYNKTSQTESSNPADYSWALFKGDQGVQGPPGDDGAPTYTWIKYADTPTSGMSDNPTGKDYIGIAYNKSTPSESNVYGDYQWSLIRGEQGIQGATGADGETYYTWIKYADSPTTGMSDNPSGKQYMGIAYNKTSPTESTNYNDYSWSKIVGETGPQGPPGEDGVDGAQGIPGADGENAADWIPGDIKDAHIGGVGDVKVWLDRDGNDNTNPGELRIEWSKIIDSAGNVRSDIAEKQSTHVLTNYGEGVAGVFFIVWTATSTHSRFGSSSTYINNNFMAVRYDGSNWRHCENASNSGDVVSFVSSDCFLFAVEARKSDGGLTGLHAYLKNTEAYDAYRPNAEIHSFAEYTTQEDLLREWHNSSGAGEISFASNTGTTGGKVLKIGNNSGNDQRWLHSRKRMPFSPTALYKVEARVRRTAGSGVCYIGITGWDSNGNPVNVTGSNSYSSQHYFAATSENPGTTWDTYTGYFQGKAKHLEYGRWTISVSLG